MLNMAVTVVIAAVCLSVCFSYSPADINQNCVYLRNPYSYYTWSQVARCDYSQDLEDDLQAVGQRTDSLEQKADSDLALLGQSAQELATDVGSLKGDGKEMFKIFVGGSFLGLFRRFCEIHSDAFASQICRFFGYTNPNVHLVHVPCGHGDDFAEPCPDTFWKYEASCYRPNGPRRFISCLYDPIPFNETCTRLVYLSCDGYTTNLSKDWMMVSAEKIE